MPDVFDEITTEQLTQQGPDVFDQITTEPDAYNKQVQFFYKAMKTDPEVTKPGFALTGFADPMGITSYASKKWGTGEYAAWQDARRQYTSEMSWGDPEKWKNLAVDFEKTILELKGMPTKTAMGTFGLHSLLQAPNSQQVEEDWWTFLKEKAWEGTKSAALGKLYDVLGVVKSPLARRGGGAVVGGAFAAAQGADVGNTLLGAAQGAVFTPYKGRGIRPVEGVTKPTDPISTIVDTHNTNGGSTIDINTGKPVTDGFSVAISKKYEQILPGEKITPEQLDAYKKAHQDVLDADPRRTIGTWVDKGQTYLDISTVVPTKAEAMDIAQKNNQIGIFDLKKFETIPTETVKPELISPDVDGMKTTAVWRNLKRDYTVEEIQKGFDTWKKTPQADLTTTGLPADEGLKMERFARLLLDKKPSAVEAMKGMGPGEVPYVPPVPGETPATTPIPGSTPAAAEREALTPPSAEDNAYLRMPLERVQADARYGVQQAQDALKQMGKPLPLASRVPQLVPSEGKSEVKDTVDTLINTISTVGKRGITEQAGPKFLYRTKIRKAIYMAKKGLSGLMDIMDKPEKIIEDFDGGKKDGPFYKTFIEPVFRQADVATNDTMADRKKFCDFVSSKVKDTDDWMFTPKPVEGLDFKLTDADRVGIALASYDKGAYRRLLGGNLYTPEQIQIIRKSVTEVDRSIGEFYSSWFKGNERLLFESASRAGYDQDKIKRVVNYFGIVSKDVSAEKQPDFVDDLSGMFFEGRGGKPSAEIITSRTAATGPLETNIAKVFYIKSARVNRFIQLAPTAANLAKVMSSKDLRRSINDRTYGRGTELLDKYLKDSINGSSARDMDDVDTTVEYLRRAGAAYAISDNILSVLRQEFLGAFNSLSNTPKLFSHYIRNEIAYPPFVSTKVLQEFIYTRSMQMKARENIPLSRVKSAEGAIAASLKGKSTISRGFRLINIADEDAALRVWKSVYDMNMEQTGGNEIESVKAADYDSRTRQSNPSSHNLPAIFRGGEVSKILTTFNTEMAPLFNIYKNEIIRARYRGEISTSTMGYKILMAHVLPAAFMGIISRGRLPKTWKEVGTDMLFYAISPLLFLSNPIQQMVTGIRSGMIVAAGPDALVRLIGSAKQLGQWDELSPDERTALVRSLMANSAKTVGGFTGKISAQQIRSVEGLLDLITQKTNDWRRLVWSENALKEPAGKEPKSKFSHK